MEGEFARLFGENGNADQGLYALPGLLLYSVRPLARNARQRELPHTWWEYFEAFLPVPGMGCKDIRLRDSREYYLSETVVLRWRLDGCPHGRHGFSRRPGKP